LNQPLAEGKGVVVRQGMDASLSRKQICGLMNTKPDAIKGLGSKCDKGAEKVNVLTLRQAQGTAWGDLLSG
jgi:hypothetical protein